MQTFTVHEDADHPADRMLRAEELVFVRDGFSLLAAVFTPVWMLVHRLWLALLIYLIGIAVLEGALWAFGLGQSTAAPILLAAHVLIGLEADSIRRWSLALRGYRMIGSVGGRSTDECERRFFEAWLNNQPFVAPAALAESLNRDAGRGHAGRGDAGRLGTLALWSRRR